MAKKVRTKTWDQFLKIGHLEQCGAKKMVKKVKIKTWDQLLKIGHLEPYNKNSISPPGLTNEIFLDQMEDLMPDDRIIYIRENGQWHSPKTVGYWVISDWMIEETLTDG